MKTQSEIPEIEAADAYRICKASEDQFYDRKAKEVDGKSLQKHAVAFANAEGGEIVIGVQDAKQESNYKLRWDGADDPEFFNAHLQALFNLTPPLPFRYDFLSCPQLGGVVLRLHIDKSQHVCQTAGGTVYQRVGAQSLPIKDAARVTQLSFAKGAQSYENSKLEGLKPELVVESDTLKKFVDEVHPKPDGLAYCINEGLIDRDDWSPLAAGVLLFSDNPQGSFPTRCETRIVFYDTRLEEPEREHLKINETVGGPLYDQIHKAVERVSEIMSGIKVLTPTGMKTVKYPPEAIWEIYVNAVLHRDYSIADDIQVRIFQNRIEIVSPGPLPAFVTLENILDVRYSRNPKLVKNLHRYRSPPNKDLGEGLNTAFQKMKDWRLKPPEIVERNNAVVVTIGHTPLASPEDAVMTYLKRHEEITNSIARELTGIKSENQMKEVFYRLRDRSLIERVPDKAGSSSAWRKSKS